MLTVTHVTYRGTHLMYIVVVCHMDDAGLMNGAGLMDEAGFLFFWTMVIFLLISNDLSWLK